MRRVCAIVSGLVLAVLCLPVPAPAAGAPRFTAPDLRTLVRQSGYIFRGTVAAVGRGAAPTQWSQPAPKGIPRPTLLGWPGNAPAISITFRVTEAIRGVREGQLITLSEWSGLWATDPARYRPGQDLLVLFYPRSRAGLTSPVGGDLGRFAVGADGRITMTGAQRRMLFGEPAYLSRAAVPRPSQPSYSDVVERVRAEAGR